MPSTNDYQDYISHTYGKRTRVIFQPSRVPEPRSRRECIFNLYNIKHIPGTETMPILLVLDRDLTVTPDGSTRHGTTAIGSRAAMIARAQGGRTAPLASTPQVSAQQQQLASANKRTLNNSTNGNNRVQRPRSRSGPGHCPS